MVLTSKRLILYFNPRSHERSDCYSNISLTFSSYFNPRSHERSDATTLRQGIYRLNFNPRSHERSDVRSNNLTILLHNFNPRSHERSDKEIESSLTAGKFQSTLPREERRIRCIFTLIFRNFNPRSHERSDHIQRAFRQTCHISIHAPTRGAT